MSRGEFTKWGRVKMRPDHELDTRWMEQAACKGEPISLFFIDEREIRIGPERAKRVCEICPVRTQCLDYAIEAPIDFGIWGGLTARERERRRSGARRPQQGRGRPL
jgi:WhiB family redox-sensing transcriptional regulator